MPLPPSELVLPTDTIHVTPWFDPADALAGHDLRSAYVERFWLPILGPTTTFLLRRLATELDQRPDGFDLPILDTAHALGLGTKGGRNAPFLRAIDRATTFHLLRPTGVDAMAVRHRAPTLSHHQVARLPVALRDLHAGWLGDGRREPSADDLRRRARRLALSLLELGEDDQAVEQQLHRWKIHPAFAHEGLQWAKARRGQGAAPEPSASGDAPVVAGGPAGETGTASDPEAGPADADAADAVEPLGAA